MARGAPQVEEVLARATVASATTLAADEVGELVLDADALAQDVNHARSSGSLGAKGIFMRWNTAVLSSLAGLALGCAHAIELPMTGRALATNPGAPELVAYLGQPGADPEACADLGGRLRDAGGLSGELTDALVSGQVPPETWAVCASALLPRLDAPRAAELLEGAVRAAAGLLAARADAAPGSVARRLQAVSRVYLERAPGGGASDGAKRALEQAARTATGPDALRAVDDLAVGLELERGRWQGRPVDEGTLHVMAADVGTALLLRVARRHPDPAIRAQAERVVVRQRIATSPFPEVTAAAAAVEALVLGRGTNPVSLAEHPEARAWLAVPAAPPRTVVARQRPLEGAATLLGRTAASPTPSVLPAVALRGIVQVEVAGLARALTLCAPDRALDPTPCIAPSDVASGSPLAVVRPSGSLRVEEEVTEDAVVGLARQGSELRIPLSIGGAPAGTLAWPVAYERPPDLVLSGSRPGDAGPDLTVTVNRLDAAHLVYRVEGGGPARSAVVEVGDAPAFRIVSRGAPGADGVDGTDGMDGSSGLAGSSASCPGFSGTDGGRGGDGTSGQDGGDGSPGGRGGDVRVIVDAPGLTAETLELVRAGIASEGGPGGRGGHGGRGGAGGRGGQGGAGATCTGSEGHTSSLSGGAPGASGSSGSSGVSGRSGPRGAPGVVHFEAAPEERR